MYHFTIYSCAVETFILQTFPTAGVVLSWCTCCIS